MITAKTLKDLAAALDDVSAERLARALNDLLALKDDPETASLLVQLQFLDSVVRAVDRIAPALENLISARVHRETINVARQLLQLAASYSEGPDQDLIREAATVYVQTVIDDVISDEDEEAA